MGNNEKKTDDLILLIIPIGLCIVAAMWYLFGFGYALLAAAIFFPIAILKNLSKK